MNSLFRILPNNLNNTSIGDKTNKTNKSDNLTIYQTDNISKKDKEKDIKDIKYWEYGNSGLKIKNFNKIMSKNLSILYYLDKTFSELVEQKQITVKKLFNKNFSETFTVGSSKIICSNGDVSIQLDHNKISGIYKLVAGGISTISNIKILPEELTKLKVPELSNVLDNLDNIKLIIKLTNILNLFLYSPDLPIDDAYSEDQV